MHRDPLQLSNHPRLRAFFIPIEQVRPCGSQPRKRFDTKGLDELAASLKQVGMLEPILVREIGKTGHYEIVAGERRWRAAQRAGLHEVPIIVRELSDEAAFEAALIENLQREDLLPLETARAYERMKGVPGATLESVAKRVGVHFSTVSNTLRLLKLPAAIQEMLDDRTLTEGHGRALLGAGDPATMEVLARDAVQHGWSVRQTERRVREASGGGSSKPKKSPNVRDLEEQLGRALNTRVEVDEQPGGAGAVTIKYSSLDELDRLLDEVLLARESGRAGRAPRTP